MNAASQPVGFIVLTCRACVLARKDCDIGLTFIHHHHLGGILCHPVTFQPRCVLALTSIIENVLDFLYGFLLFEMGLSEPFQDFLFLPFQSSGLTIFRTNLDDL